MQDVLFGFVPVSQRLRGGGTDLVKRLPALSRAPRQIVVFRLLARDAVALRRFDAHRTEACLHGLRASGKALFSPWVRML